MNCSTKVTLYLSKQHENCSSQNAQRTSPNMNNTQTKELDEEMEEPTLAFDFKVYQKPIM